MNSVAELPYNLLLGIESLREGDDLLRLPEGGQYLNHLGTVHAGALLSLAEAASGEFLLRALGAMQGIVPVVRRMESKFRKPANGAVSARARAEGMEEFTASLNARGRALISVSVDLHDASGTHCLSAEVEWYVQRLP